MYPLKKNDICYFGLMIGSQYLVWRWPLSPGIASLRPEMGPSRPKRAPNTKVGTQAYDPWDKGGISGLRSMIVRLRPEMGPIMSDLGSFSSKWVASELKTILGVGPANSDFDFFRC